MVTKQAVVSQELPVSEIKQSMVHVMGEALRKFSPFMSRKDLLNEEQTARVSMSILKLVNPSIGPSLHPQLHSTCQLKALSLSNKIGLNRACTQKHFFPVRLSSHYFVFCSVWGSPTKNKQIEEASKLSTLD